MIIDEVIDLKDEEREEKFIQELAQMASCEFIFNAHSEQGIDFEKHFH